MTMVMHAMCRLQSLSEKSNKQILYSGYKNISGRHVYWMHSMCPVLTFNCTLYQSYRWYIQTEWSERLSIIIVINLWSYSDYITTNLLAEFSLSFSCTVNTDYWTSIFLTVPVQDLCIRYVYCNSTVMIP